MNVSEKNGKNNMKFVIRDLICSNYGIGLIRTICDDARIFFWKFYILHIHSYTS